MRSYLMLHSFGPSGTSVYCFTDFQVLVEYIKESISSDCSYYLKQEWLTEDMINKLNIVYIKEVFLK